MDEHRHAIFRRDDFQWVLQESDPAEIAFPASSPFANWSLFNPLVAPPKGQAPGPLGDRLDCTPIGRDRCFVSSRRMDFGCTVGDAAAALREIMRLLRWLRFTTGQASLATEISFHQQYPGVGATSPRSAPFSAPATTLLRTHILEGALTFDRIQAALVENPEMSVPLFGDLLLDAIEADGDDRKVILYSAIAVEVMASTRLEEMHRVAVVERPGDLRLVPVPQAGDATLQKDPVFDELRKGAERNFRFLLHEIPLYVARKSLMIDDQNLFQEVMVLHKTRNKLVHIGGVDPNGQLPINHEGAKRALKAAMDLYSWFGARGRYVTMHNFERSGMTRR